MRASERGSSAQGIDSRTAKTVGRTLFHRIKQNSILQVSLLDLGVTDVTFGKITSAAVNPRLIQFALQYSLEMFRKMRRCQI